jgi:dTDP-L-rhamnose 4-epimerase
MRKKILITGGAGFIGSNLIQSLSDMFEVYVLDNLDPQIHGVNGKSYTYSLIKGKCNFILGDVSRRLDWEKALENNIEIVIHLASQTGTGQSMYKSTSYTNSNCIGTTILGDLLEKYPSVKKIVLASSRSIYGEGKYIDNYGSIVFPHNRHCKDLENGIFECLDPNTKEPLKVQPTDENSKINPVSTYALTKYFQEKHLQNICESKRLSFVGLRFQNVYGPGQSLSNPYTGIISIFSNRIKLQKPIYIFEDGKESRDFVFIEDVVNALILAINYENSICSIYNVGSGEMTSVIDVANKLRHLLNGNSDIFITGQYRNGDIRHNYADLSKIKRELGYSPIYNFTKGIEKYILWANNQELEVDKYEQSIRELIDNGLLSKE